MFSFIKGVTPRWLISVIKFLAGCRLYFEITLFQFFTKTRIGSWFYCGIFVFFLVQPNFINAFFFFLIFASGSHLAILKSLNNKAFAERFGDSAKMVQKSLDDHIKESPLWILANTCKPLLFFALLLIIADSTEVHRVDQINRHLHNLEYSDYMNKWALPEEKIIARRVILDIIHQLTPPSSLAGAFSVLNVGILKDPSITIFILTTLIVIVLLVWLEEWKRGKPK